jgi:hypothetical protein
MRIGTRLLVLVLGLAAPTTAISQDSSNGRDESPADIVATQVRDQGYRCDNPTSATQDQESEGDAVWTLKCGNATYRVRLVPDMAAAIEKIDD